MARVPVQHRLGFRDRRQMGGVAQALHRHRAQVGDMETVARLQGFRRRRRQADAEAGGAVLEAEEHGFGRRPERARFVERERRLVHRRARLHHDPVDADDIGPRARVCGECGQRRLIGAPVGRTVNAAVGVAELRMGAEVEAGRHASGKSHGRESRAMHHIVVIYDAFDAVMLSAWSTAASTCAGASSSRQAL